MFAHLRVNCVFLFIFAIDNETKITHNSMKTNRRDFLKAVGGIGLFSIVPSSVLGGRGRVARVSKKAPRKAKPAVPATEEI